jgi:hypothetical protein
MLNVLLTVDTEVWPELSAWPTDMRLSSEPEKLLPRIDVDIMGRTAHGDFGLDYQLATLRRHGLKAVYFVEPLFSAYVGKALLDDIVGRIIAAGQEAQLHLHTEWLSDIHEPGLPLTFRQFMFEFDLDEQTALIGWGKRRLEASGAPPVIAFRAGNYGANEDTLRALSRSGLRFDSSHNPCAAHDGSMFKARPLFGPMESMGVVELPVSVFQDAPRSLRPAQLGACSLTEMTSVLEGAHVAGWRHFTIVLHSFEMIRGRKQGATPRRDPIVTQRFEGLCAYLERHQDRFRTVGFSELAEQSFENVKPPVEPVRNGRLLRLARQAEQALGVLFM